MNPDALEFAKELLERQDDEAVAPEEALGYLEGSLRSWPEDPDVHDAAVAMAATLLRGDERLPEWLASFSADVLDGNRKRPSRRGPNPNNNSIRDYRLSRAVAEVAHRYGLPRYSNNELSAKGTAAEIVANATSHGIDVVIKAVKRFGG